VLSETLDSDDLAYRNLKMPTKFIKLKNRMTLISLFYCSVCAQRMCMCSDAQ
jgi:hypothetical protein